MPCQKCGKMVGGHEKHGEVVWNSDRTSGYRCCWECRDEEKMKEEMTPWHERYKAGLINDR